MTQEEVLADLFELLTKSYTFSEDIAQDVILAYLQHADQVEYPRAWCLQRAKWRRIDLMRDGLRHYHTTLAEDDEQLISPEPNSIRVAESRQTLDRLARRKGVKSRKRWRRFREDYRMLLIERSNTHTG